MFTFTRPSLIIQACADVLGIIDNITQTRIEKGFVGGYFCDVDPIRLETPRMVIYLGDLPRDLAKLEKYHKLSIMKAQRLAPHKNHRTSWQSRDRDNCYQGAVRFQERWGMHYETIFSFSGLSAEQDEAMCLGVCVLTGFQTREQAQAIANITGNNFFHLLAENISS